MLRSTTTMAARAASFDQAYVVVLPEWADQYAMPVAHGSTYEEAAQRRRNAVENYKRDPALAQS